jgi:hypothetical protein
VGEEKDAACVRARRVACCAGTQLGCEADRGRDANRRLARGARPGGGTHGGGGRLGPGCRGTRVGCELAQAAREGGRATSDADAVHTCMSSWAREKRMEGTTTHCRRETTGAAARGVANSSGASVGTGARVRRAERGMWHDTCRRVKGPRETEECKEVRERKAAGRMRRRTKGPSSAGQRKFLTFKALEPN